MIEEFSFVLCIHTFVRSSSLLITDLVYICIACRCLFCLIFMDEMLDFWLCESNDV